MNLVKPTDPCAIADMAAMRAHPLHMCIEQTKPLWARLTETLVRLYGGKIHPLAGGGCLLVYAMPDEFECFAAAGRVMISLGMYPCVITTYWSPEAPVETRGNVPSLEEMLVGYQCYDDDAWYLVQKYLERTA